MPAGRKPAHSREEFVRTALVLADESGLSGLSIRTLAVAVGVTPATVYRYFTDKDDLLSAMWQSVLASLIADVPDGSPGERLVAIAQMFRARVRAHPCVIELSVIPASGGTFVEVAKYVIGQLRAMGLTGSSVVQAYRQFESMVVGTCLFDFAGAPHHLTSRLQRMTFLDDKEFTAVLGTSRDIEADNERAFDSTLRMLVDGFARGAS